ncbi:hypothetical protein ACJJTC_016874 [Scirpophaga incertulas]
MTLGLLFFAALCILVNAEDVHKKNCSPLYSTECVVHSVAVEPCRHGPKFCAFVAGKRYSVSVNFTTYFTAENLKVAVSTDYEDSGVLSVLKTYKDACRSLLMCPVEAHVRHSFEVPLAFNKRVQGKFPVQVKLWNEDNESQACCFTFKAKIK